jgi:hypothetical protein
MEHVTIIPNNQDTHYPEYTHEYLRKHLKQFYKYLRDNPKVWAIMQIKNAMITGSRHVFLGKIRTKDYKIGRTVFNIFKWKQIKNNRYYHKKSNRIVTSEAWRKIIDVMVDLGFHWYLKQIWVHSEWFPMYGEIIAIWPMDYHLRD